MIDKNIAIIAPDFNRVDSRGRTITLADYRDKLNVVLAFNRGFG
jgi:peroxiredoxin